MDKEIDLQILLAEESLDEAKILFENEHYIGAISRVYYSMFHSAKALLLSKGLNPKKHRGILKILGLEFIKTGILDNNYAQYYKYVFDLRQEADYGSTFDIDKKKAEICIVYAEEFLRKVKEIINELK